MTSNSRKILVLWVLIIAYTGISLIFKASGLDLFTIANSSPNLAIFSAFVMGNPYLYSLVSSALLSINYMFVIGVSNRVTSSKLLAIICLSCFPILFILNIAIFFSGVSELIITTLIPFVVVVLISLIKPKRGIFKKLETRLDSVLTTIIIFVIFTIICFVFQQALMFLKINLFNINYIENNLFNEILLNLDFFVYLWAIYKSQKIYIKGE